MSIADVMSRVTALQDLIGQSDAPAQAPAAPTQTAAPTAFGDALAASSAGSAPSAGSSSDSSSSVSQSELLSLLEQSSAAQSLTSGLSSDGSDSSGFSLPALPSLSATLASALSPATTTSTPTIDPASSGGTGAQGVLAAAESQVGVTEQPPGSNDGPQIAVYRDAVAGAAPGQPWCASFVSWAAAQAGEPIGPSGQGFDSVQQITDWAGSTGRLLPATATPAPGDLILFGDHHVGIVEAVNTDGSLTTVEGNYANSVQYVQRSPSEATGYVQM